MRFFSNCRTDGVLAIDAEFRKKLVASMLLLFGRFALCLLIFLHRFSLFLGISAYGFSLLFSGFAGFLAIFSDAAVFALSSRGDRRREG